MNIELVTFIIALSFGMLSIYVSQKIGRRPIDLKNIFIDLGTIFGGLAFYSIVIWSFIYLTWWLIILSFLWCVFIIIIPFIAAKDIQERIGLIFRIKPILDIGCIVLTAYLWWFI